MCITSVTAEFKSSRSPPVQFGFVSNLMLKVSHQLPRTAFVSVQVGASTALISVGRTLRSQSSGESRFARTAYSSSRPSIRSSASSSFRQRSAKRIIMAKSGGESAVDFGYSLLYPFALRAAVLLNVPEIVHSAGAPMSAADICARLAPAADGESPSAENLDRVLEILSCHGVLAADGKNRKYASTAKLAELADGAAADFVRVLTAPELVRVWPHMDQFVLRPDRSTFEAVYGKGAYQYLREDAPDMLALQVGMMTKMSARHLDFMLDHYDGEFRRLQGTLVDVGGSKGHVAAAIASKYPNLDRVVNFDLPEIVAAAPPIRGVEHVGGSFLDFVPPGDLLILKFVLLNWNDEQVVTLLRNCCNALPAKGKAIIIDRVKLDSYTGADKLRMASQDVVSSLLFKGGKQRTLQELQRLGEAAGFARVQISATSDTLTVLEAVKA